MAQLLRYGESNFWFVSSCNGLRVFAAVWPYSPGRNLAVGVAISLSDCTVRIHPARGSLAASHGQLKFTLSQARNRQTVTCAASLVLCVAHTFIGRTRCPWQGCSGGPRSLPAASASSCITGTSPSGFCGPSAAHCGAEFSRRAGVSDVAEDRRIGPIVDIG